MNIALTFISLGHKKVGYMPPDAVLIADSVASKDLLQSLQHMLAKR
jgi:hypothetical protein